jgi:peptidoglycan/xylan/chitin deacetylase (PgdA/CDA1 family)
MSIAKTIARKVFFPALIGIKADKLFLKSSGGKCAIINFHGVTDVIGNRFNNRHLDVSEFENLVIYLKNNYQVVSLKELFEIHRSEKKPAKRTIALTFDDGYINNFTIALPVLRKHNIPATYYLITKGFTDPDYYVWPDIIDLVQRHVKHDIILDAGTFKYPGFYSAELKQSLVDFLKTCGSKREKYISELASQYPYYKETAGKYPQLIELVRKNEFSQYSDEKLIEYGSHTHTHFNLEFLNAQECKSELMESRRIITELTGKAPLSLAFPDGSYSKETKKIALSLGYTNQVAVDYKFNEANKDPNLLSRFTVSNSTTWQSNAIRLARDFKKYAF